MLKCPDLYSCPDETAVKHRVKPLKLAPPQFQLSLLSEHQLRLNVNICTAKTVLSFYKTDSDRID